MKLKEVFEKSVQFFKEKKIETARLDAELLLAHALKIERMQIYLKYDQPLSEAEVQACREVIRRRSHGEPVAFITGEKGFYGLSFFVGEGVLIPRPETELMVESALEFIQKNKIESPRILDLGAGTGCIGFSILKNCKTASLVSVEKSEHAFEYLKRNIESLELNERAELILSDVMELNLKNETFDIIVANPPYIAEGDHETEINVKKYEPALALFAKSEGYSALFDWSSAFRQHLKKPGLMMFEMGYQQGPRLKQHFESFQQYTEIKIVKDLSGLDRFVRSIQ